MKVLTDLAEDFNLLLVEDACQAHGAEYSGKKVGRFGIGCFSFYPVKHMTTAEGGMLITKDKDIAEKVERLRAFGVDRHMGERKVPGVYDVTMLGYNYRMNEIEAAMGIEQLKRMNEFLRVRKENYGMLSRGLKEISGISQLATSHGDYQSSYYCLSVILEKALAPKRFEIVDYLKKNGIGTSVYYPKPVPHMSYYRQKYGYGDDSYPEAAMISYSSIALPVGPHLQREDIKYIIETLKKAITEVKRQ